MEFVTGALGTLLPKLGELLNDEYNLQKGAKKDIQFLTKELESSHAVLRSVGEVPPEQLKEEVRIWARDVREVSYDMEDIVDTFLVRVEGPEPPSKRSTKRFIKEMIRKVTKAPTTHHIAQDIKDIKERVKEVAERRERYKSDCVNPATATTSDDPRRATRFTKATSLVGIDEAREDLIKRLTKGGDSIISIVGFGGLGKTTLAKAVYDKLIKAHKFDCTAFVTVSRSPDKEKVLKDMLYKLDKVTYADIHNKKLDIEFLTDLVQEFLQNKRYFIVIDDIWEQTSWEAIKCALVENDCGCSIITTTRNFEVARLAGEVYKLKPLSYDNSKELFFTRIFGGEGKCFDNHSDEVSDKILKKCDGIPLAIITMASLLVDKPRAVWSELYKDIGFGHKDNLQVENTLFQKQVENTMRILSFSYYDMPPRLRTCLLYLSVFPEDYVITKDTLVRMWIAEGFVYKEQEKGLLEIGEGYFNDLINRCMIQAVQSEFDCTIEGCRVHDMVLDLICSLSRKENFVTVLDNAEGVLSSGNKVRRLSCQKDDYNPQADHMQMHIIRSYIVCACTINQRALLLNFKLLRVLTIDCCNFKEDYNHLENLGNLLHLRYLSIRNTSFVPRKEDMFNRKSFKLPEEIGNLKFLQTLDFDMTDIKELPVSIVRLPQLLCLSCGDWGIMEVPDGIGKMTSLEDLTINFTDGYDEAYESNVRRFVKELGSLTNLRFLKINFFFVDQAVQRYLVESLRNLKKIRHIELVIGEFYYVDADIARWEATGSVLPRHLCHLSLPYFQFSRLPSWINICFYNLSYLALRLVTMDEQDLKLLGSLMELRYLNLEDMEATVTASKINACDRFFRKLRWLELRRVMVQFQQNEDESFSFHIWNGIDPVPFGTRRKGCSVQSTLMSDLEVLKTSVFVRALEDASCDCSDIGLGYLTSLQNIQVFMQCQGATAAEVRAAEAEVRYAVKVHPNRPTLEVNKWSKDEMVSL